MPHLVKSGRFKTYTSVFTNARGKDICCYYWEPLTDPRGLVFLSHGITEHCMVYDELASELARRNFLVFAHDHVGHGRSSGSRCIIHSLKHLVEDTVFHIKKIQKSSYPDLPLFLCGHSMGGSVSLMTSLEKEVQVSGIVLIAPALESNPDTATPFKLALAKVASKLVPKFPVAYVDYKKASRDNDSVKIMKKDPLRHHGFFKARPIVSLIEGGKDILSKRASIQVPFLLLHGDCDLVCHVSGAREFYHGAATKDKSMKIYSGAYHCLLQEPKEVSRDVFNKTIEWIDERA